MEAAASAPPLVERRYSALRTISTILRILAIVIGVVGGVGVLIGGGISASQGELGGGVALLIGGVLYVALFVLFFFAYAELIRLLVDVEENTRQSAVVMASLVGGSSLSGRVATRPAAGESPGQAPPPGRGTPFQA